VKKLGVVRSIISNVFTEQGEIENLEDLIYNGQDGNVQQRIQYGRFGILMLKSNNGQANDYDVQILNPAEAVTTLGLLPPVRHGDKLDWTSILDAYGGGYIAGVSVIYFLQPNGTELRGTFSVNELDPSYLVVTIEDKPSNTVMAGRTTVDAIVDPYNFNPKRPNKENTDQTITSGVRYLMLDDVNNSENVGQTYGETPYNNAYDGPDAWKNLNGSDPIIKGNSIIEWDGAEWTTVFDPDTGAVPTYFQNLRTGIQYRWDGEQWLKSFEGEYGPGYWRFELTP
jgi:hypothetical protein